jgi:hypothetical protein
MVNDSNAYLGGVKRAVKEFGSREQVRVFVTDADDLFKHGHSKTKGVTCCPSWYAFKPLPVSPSRMAVKMD